MEYEFRALLVGNAVVLCRYVEVSEHRFENLSGGATDSAIFIALLDDREFI